MIAVYFSSSDNMSDLKIQAKFLLSFCIRFGILRATDDTTIVFIS